MQEEGSYEGIYEDGSPEGEIEGVRGDGESDNVITSVGGFAARGVSSKKGQQQVRIA